MAEVAADLSGDWASAFFHVVDTLDVDRIASRVTQGAHLRFGRAFEAFGKPAIRQVLVQAARHFDSVHHEPVEIWSKGTVAIFDSNVTWVRSGTGAVSLPVTHVLHRAGNLICDWYLSTYLDLATENRIAVAFDLAAQRAPLSA